MPRLWRAERNSTPDAQPSDSNYAKGDWALLGRIEGTGIGNDPKGPLFRTIGRRSKQLTRTPQLYDRGSDEVTLDEVERVGI